MNQLDVYYHLRPLIPRGLQIAARRCLAKRKYAKVRHCWPILESAGVPPLGWQGWPDGKDFALVLTHDVETRHGHDQCRYLMDLEESLGFRSSFNFIPEQRYTVSPELRSEMESRGFEVGVHGLCHDGRLFSSREIFAARKPRINRYIREWNAVGFRSPSMRANLRWIGELDIAYDLSTFDTDPFEPHPFGAETIFPFLIERTSAPPYVEMPYTLPQDSTLFVILGENTSRIWKKKLDWVVNKGGMVLLNTHPDYMRFGESGRAPRDSYESTLFAEFLRDIRERYNGRYWHVLPRDMAAFWMQTRHTGENRGVSCCVRRGRRIVGQTAKKIIPKRIWIDMDNTPHVPFFRPIIRELEDRGYDVMVTARDAFQVCDLADYMKVPYVKIGRHYGKNRFAKVWGLFFRAAQLAPIVWRQSPDLALSHGSRSQLILSTLLRIRSVLIEDYEHAQFPPLMRPTWRIAPDVIPDTAIATGHRAVKKYPGIKEDVYVGDFTPDSGMCRLLGVSPEDMIVTVRPPATEAHYHNPESETLLAAAMGVLLEHPTLRIVLLPRNQNQASEMRMAWPDGFSSGRIIVPDHAMDGLNLLWFSDLVISGGGTMNREAAALGVPVYSIFRGLIGAVDRHLSETGRLVLLESVDGVRRQLVLTRRDKSGSPGRQLRAALDRIVGHIVDILES